MTDYAAVLTHRHAGRQWALNGDQYEGLTMLDGGEKPTKKSLDEAWPSVKIEMQNAAVERETARASALAKLKALGLTDAEIAALAG